MGGIGDWAGGATGLIFGDPTAAFTNKWLGDSLSRGKGTGNFVQDMFNPLQSVLGADVANSIDPGGASMAQAITNTFNVIQGKESFGSHKNWFGNGYLADMANPIMGGFTDEERAQDEANIKAWNDYYTGRLHRASATNSGSSLLEDE